METILPPDDAKPRLLAGPTRNYNFAPELQAQPPADSVGLNQLTAALWHRKGRIGAAMLIGVLIGIAAGLAKHPVYRARTSLQLQGFNENYFLRDVSSASPVVGTGTAETYLQDQVKILESDAVARRVADQMGIMKPASQKTGLLSQFGRFVFPNRRHLTPEEQRLKLVKKSITVRTSLQSQVVEVFYDSPNPELAAKGANAVAAQYIALNREARWQLAQDTTDWLNKETGELKIKLEKSGQDLQDYARSSGLMFSGNQGGLSEDRIHQLQDELSKAEADRAAKQSRYATAMATPRTRL